MQGPRYPVYIPSRGRPDGTTAAILRGAGVPYRVVVEPQDADAYRAVHGDLAVRVLPESGMGLAYSRNWITAHAASSPRHWQIDDDLTKLFVRQNGKPTPADPVEFLSAMEQFCDRYTNVALASPRQAAFAWTAKTPYSLNQHVYGCMLMQAGLPVRWRGTRGEDTDMNLQILTTGLYCTVLFNEYTFTSPSTGSNAGGHELGEIDDGFIQRARELERMWPGLVKVTRRWGRPGHNLAHIWRRFDTPLRKVEG